MAIAYSLIARGFTILCSHQIGNGDFERVAEQMLRNIPTDRDTKTTYTGNNNFVFHVLVNNGIIYMCVASSDFGQRQPYAYLSEIQRQFQNGGHASRAHFVGPMDLQGDFGRVLALQMEKFSTSQPNDGVSQLRAQVDEVKGVMTQNIEKVLERGEKLDDLVDKTTELEESSKTFQKTARRVRRKYWWQNMKMKLIIGFVVLIVIVVLVIIILYSTGVLGGSGDSPSVATTPAATTIKAG